MRKILLGTTAVAGAALMGMNMAVAQVVTQSPQPTAPALAGVAAGEARGAPPVMPFSVHGGGGVPAAGTFQVRLGGFFEFNAGWIDDSNDKLAVNAGGTNVRSRSQWDFRTDAEIYITAAGKTANGLSYGAQFELEFDNVIGSGSGTGMDTDEMWGWVSSPTLGTVMFGDQDSAADLMKVSLPGAVLRLGPSSEWDEFVSVAADGNRYLVTDINDGSDATKIIYVSPQFFGFDFGASFAPNRREGEQFFSVTTPFINTAANPGGAVTPPPASQVLQRDPNDSIRNELSLAARYRGSFNNIGIQASLGYQQADAQAISNAPGVVGLQDIREWQVGAQISGFGFALGAAYRWGDYGSVTMSPLRQGLSGSSTWGVGATYTMGAWQFGAHYGEATRDNGSGVVNNGNGTFSGASAATFGTAAAAAANNNQVGLADRTQKVFAIGVSYLIAPGLEAYVNYTNVEDRNIATNTTSASAAPITLAAPGSGSLTRNRDIDVVVIGTRITF
ncbi:porin [Falsiroseomonas oryzae]|uniref:porin n=1 Tax=Falsiroseomonas oryzae TaxID=2766473 RepID=UPI0022EABA53|nr:porin [Roseomonas sp. MO-31]